MTKIFTNCRDKFVAAVEEVLDLLEYDNYSNDYNNFDVFVSSGGENYIINRNTGEYINRYKFTHIGWVPRI